MKIKVSLTIEKKLVDDVKAQIDGLHVKNLSQAIEYLVSKSLGKEKVAVVMCGGPDSASKLGGEYKFTLKLAHITVIEEIIRKLKLSGFKTIYIVGHDEPLTKIFTLLGNGDILGVKVSYVKDIKGEGTMNALRRLKGKINTNFLLVFGDIYFDFSLDSFWQAHTKNAEGVTLLLVTHKEPSERGVVMLEGNKVMDFMQKPNSPKSHIAFESILAAGPEIFEYDGNSIENDVLPVLAKKGLLFGHFTSGKIININTPSELAQSKKLARKFSQTTTV